MTHTAVLLIGALTLGWLAVPIAPANWESLGSIHWDLLLVPAVVLSVAAGLAEALLISRGWFAAAVGVLLIAAMPVWWVCGLFVGDAFGSTLDTTANLVLASMIGWVTYVGGSWLLADAVSALARPRARNDHKVN